MSATRLEIPDLAEQLQSLVAQVPPGRVTTYSALAKSLGNSMATRWVAHYALGQYDRGDAPFHRVVPGDGQIGRYSIPDREARIARLAAEGVEVRSGAVDVAKLLFRDFVGDHPLERLQELQRDVESQVTLRGVRKVPAVVAGVDVSYPADDEGVAAYTLLDVETGKLLWSTTVRCRVKFPYIPTYLTFRELPVHLELFDKVREAGKMAEVVLVDGTGILHPRHAGIATHLGVIADLPTIGVTKRLLVGRVDLEGIDPLESRPIEHEGKTIGVAIRPSARTRRPLFVSPGHRIDLKTAEAIVRRVLLGRRLPEPLFWADHLSRMAGKEAATP